MRISRVFVSAVLAASALSLSTGTAIAGDFGRAEASPSSAFRGDTVTVNTTYCGESATSAKGQTTAAAGKGYFRLDKGTHKGLLVGQFTVARDAVSGDNGIAVLCPNGKMAQTDVWVVDRKKPVGPVHTGLGGSIGGMNTGQIAGGTALLAAAAAGGVVVMRRRAQGTRA